MGLAAVVLVLILCVTGLALNHTETLRLDERFVGSSWLLAWYGIDAPGSGHSRGAGAHWVTLLGDRIYVDEIPLAGHFSELTAAVAMPGQTVVIADGDVLILTPEAELVERLGRQDGVPAGIEAAALVPDTGLVVRASHGLYTVDEAFLQWRHIELPRDAPSWSRPGVLPEELLRSIRRHYRGHILPVERVLLDLHSGRLFGRYGTLLMDLAALALIALSLTGCWIWLRRWR